MQLPSEFTAATSEASGALSETEGVGFDGTPAQGRAGQSPHKDWLLLAFAKRVVDGEAKPHETAFMAALMAADIPARGLIDDARDVANTVAFLSWLGEMDPDKSTDAVGALAARLEKESSHGFGGE